MTEQGKGHLEIEARAADHAQDTVLRLADRLGPGLQDRDAAKAAWRLNS